MIPRLLTPYLKQDSSWYPVVTLTGPRQSGKTTLVRSVFPEYRYISLEELDNRGFAIQDPRGFLSEYNSEVIIDEVQHAPDLLSYIQVLVDADDAPGRYILTGSHNLLLMKNVSQSLAGRTGILYVLPFSRAELERDNSPETAGKDLLFDNRRTSRNLWDAIFYGFYPRIHDKAIPPVVWYQDYIIYILIFTHLVLIIYKKS